MKRLDCSKRCCPKCGGKIDVIRRDLSMPRRDRMPTLGCVSGIHIQQPDTWGYDLRDFPLCKTLKPIGL
jgi:hypothetical protein